MANVNLQKLVNNLACPIDGFKLVQNEKQLVCESRHSFDIARAGYVNLLPVQHKRSKQPGDSKAMVLARADFLNTGVYQAIAEQLVDSVSSFLTEGSVHCLLDAGCGEGYYFDYLYTVLNKPMPHKPMPHKPMPYKPMPHKPIAHKEKTSENLSFIGLDISKDAIVQAAKRNKQISWVVGTNRQPPVENESVDIILCLFGFVNFAGFSKVLKPGGVIIFVDPGPEHLKELRAIIYDEGRSDRSQSEVGHLETGCSEKAFSGHQPGSGFSELEQKRLQYKATVYGQTQVNNLFLMTPHFYRASQAGRLAVAKLESLDITVDVVFSVFRKNVGSVNRNSEELTF